MILISKYGRTDLASEAQAFPERSELRSGHGLAVREEELDGFAVMAVDVENREGSEVLGLPCGRYATLRLSELVTRGAPAFPSAVSALSRLIRRFLPEDRLSSVLIAALGNPDVTPDALGPLASEYILVTRHLRDNPVFQAFRSTALCRTGVLGTTGMESAFQIQTLCASLRPDCVLVIDALAAAEPESLCRCVQVTDAGIAPGSGVGNDRARFSRDSLGVPVVAIGVPTVVDAASLSDRDSFASFFVTPRYIDTEVRRLSRLIGYAVNLALHPGLNLETIDQLLD